MKRDVDNYKRGSENDGSRWNVERSYIGDGEKYKGYKDDSGIKTRETEEDEYPEKKKVRISILMLRGFRRAGLQRLRIGRR